MDQIQLGTQIWMTKNLDVDHFRNGDPILEAQTDKEWEQAGKNKQPAWCYYENSKKIGKLYGRLYNWYAVVDPRGLAPVGWHIPMVSEWKELADYLGGEENAGYKMKSTNGWDDYEYFNTKLNEYKSKIGNGNDESGFSGLPGGARGPDGEFGLFGYEGDWRSCTAGGSSNSKVINLDHGTRYFSICSGGNEDGFSVRCVQD